ncbi:Protein of unknown function [Micromonospora purpureochromogenes]|uniref:DUF402 domain-containing protein n=1 Tax=Micromonospora purpureochromogenes TaxID=47872 RepID=A0A1C5A219_9ACTN|nr:DUF402 domain-containing protein [Micromonospora purpureochromogenes]SCF39253.1 Protein of unknown function [Micromonospora purpureochromogenes]
MRYGRGQLIVRRGMHPDGRIGAVQAGRVVADDERGLALWVDVGAATMRRRDLAGTPTRALPIRAELTTPTLLAPGTWGPYRTLMVMPPGAAHSVWWSWTANGDFAGWYVNLEAPMRRWRGGVDVEDHALDLLITPDGRWTWKDEDEFAAQTNDPLFWDTAAALRIREEGELLLARAVSRRYPFDGTWQDFQPEPGWPPAPLPHWWDVPADGCQVWDDSFYAPH